MLIVLLFGLACIIVLTVLILYASTHPLTSFRFQLTNPTFIRNSSGNLNELGFLVNVVGHNQNYLSDLAAVPDEPLNLHLLELPSSSSSPNCSNTDSFLLGNVTLHRRHHRFLFQPGKTSRWHVEGHVPFPKSSNLSWQRYLDYLNGSNSTTWSYFWFLNGTYTIARSLAPNQTLKVCSIVAAPGALALRNAI
jgi:hypothetical protein